MSITDYNEARLKSNETYSAAALSILLIGIAGNIGFDAMPVQETTYTINSASSPTAQFEPIQFLSKVESEIFPTMPKKKKISARVKNVRKLEFSKELFV